MGNIGVERRVRAPKAKSKAKCELGRPMTITIAWDHQPAALVLMMRMSSSAGRRALTISGLLLKVIPVEVMNFRSENVLGSSLTRNTVPL